MPVPVYVISGILGAGKSTFINHVLETAPDHLRILVLVNEFGSLSIDKRIIKTDPLNIVDLSGGCICCSMFTELMASLRFALDTFKADIILIESTGLALPREIARQALTPIFEGRLEFGGIVTLVDAASGISDEYPMALQQVKEANVVILNKIDLVDGQRLLALQLEISCLLPAGSSLLAASFGRVDFGQVFGRLYDPGHLSLLSGRPKPAPLDSTAGFAVVCLVRHAAAPRDQILKFYQEHGNLILRSKGFVLMDQGEFQLQFTQVGLEVTEVQEPIRMTELVLIVREEHRDLIERELKKVFGAAGGGIR